MIGPLPRYKAHFANYNTQRVEYFFRQSTYGLYFIPLHWKRNSLEVCVFKFRRTAEAASVWQRASKMGPRMHLATALWKCVRRGARCDCLARSLLLCAVSHARVCVDKFKFVYFQRRNTRVCTVRPLAIPSCRVHPVFIYTYTHSRHRNAADY